MTGRFVLTDEQVVRLGPQVPRACGTPGVEDRRVLGRIIHVRRNGLGWQDALAIDGPHKILHDRFVRWSRLGRIRPHLPHPGPARPHRRRPHDRQPPPEGAPHGGKPQKEGGSRGPRARQGWAQLQAPHGQRRTRPTARRRLSPGSMSDAKGAWGLLTEGPAAKRLLGGPGHDADWLRDELKSRGVRACIPARRKRKRPASHNRKLNKPRRIEKALARLKDWRGLATPCTR